MNSCTISGRVTHTIELRHADNGDAVCEFDVAVRRPHSRDVTDFFTVVCWGKKAEIAAAYFGRGKPIEILGIMTIKKYETKEGVKKSKLVIKCEDLQFAVGDKPSDDSHEPENVPSDEQFEEIEDDDDLPF